MIPNTNLRSVSTSGVQSGTTFEISADDTAFIMSILRGNIYSDEVLAVLREYSANAWDAHRMVGKHDRPIKVTLPSSIDPVLRIRDYGPGMSQEEVFNIYAKYGKSTKRTTEDAVGMMGIGSKSAFAYSDSFTVTSWNGGTKSIYNAVLDASDRGVINLLHSEPCGDETGIEIQVPVEQKDIFDFQKKARDLFQHFVPRPEINIDLPPVDADAEKLENGYLSANSAGEWIAIMGCIPYRVDINQLADQPDFDISTFQEIGGALRFKIGEVQISASREELRYTDHTKAKLVEKFNALVDEFVTKTLDSIESGNFTPWEKRLRAQVLNKLHLPVPDDVEELFSAWVVLKDLSEDNSATGRKLPWTLQRGRNNVASIYIDERVVIYIQDDRRALGGFGLNDQAYVVKPFGKVKLEDVRKSLDDTLAKYELTGVPIELLSTMPWTQPTRGYRGRGGVSNIKHRVKSFKLNPNSNMYKPCSNNWEPEIARVPSDDDVFVIMANFKTSYGFYNLYRHDSQLAKVFGKTMPDVYGYKTTMAKPVFESSCKGTEYLQWRKKFYEEILTDANKRLIALKPWANMAGEIYISGIGYTDAVTDEVVASLATKLGSDHAITSFVHRALSAKRELASRGVSDEVLNWLRGVCDKTLVESMDKEVTKERDAISARYPMLGLASDNFVSIWRSSIGEKCIEYIKLVDNNKKEEK